ncbi:MAG: glycoside hydrolase family 3 N-terminal domain-containing protein [Pseudomonadota bacterium]
MYPPIQLLAGQRLMAGFDGTRFDWELEYLIKTLRVGGLILFSRNIDSRPQVRELCAEAQSCARDNNLPPLFIAIDQEGGEVARLRPPVFKSLPGAPEMDSLDTVRQFADLTAEELRSIFVNMNMAPVMDCIPPGVDSIMKKRAFRGSPKSVAAMGCQVIRTFQDQGIMAVAKHFPGIGRTTIDSHLSLPVLNADRFLLEATDLVPFAEAIRADVCGIMLSHILYPDLDSQWPASLSVEIGKTLLRDTMGYEGLTMTDDLDMGAISHPIETSIRRILEAEIDMALICHKGPDLEGAFDIMCRLFTDDVILKAGAVKSLERILRAKSTYLGE